MINGDDDDDDDDYDCDADDAHIASSDRIHIRAWEQSALEEPTGEWIGYPAQGSFDSGQQLWLGVEGSGR